MSIGIQVTLSEQETEVLREIAAQWRLDPAELLNELVHGGMREVVDSIIRDDYDELARTVTNAIARAAGDLPGEWAAAYRNWNFEED